MSSDPKNQHFVPSCYLSQFANPVDGFVRIFSRDGKNKRKQKPEKTFRSNHLYTVNIQGKKNYKIEQTLSNIEGMYAKIFREKIKEKLPLTEYEHIVFCIFVAAQMQRTLRFKRNQENFIQQIIEHGEQISLAHDAIFKDKAKWESYKNDIHKLQLIDGVQSLTEILSQMSIAFICSVNPSRNWFITSDDPCNLFNPDLQWQRFLGPVFGQKNIQLTLPLSPEVTAMFCWANYHGYSKMSGSKVEDLNRMTRAHCDKEFASPFDQKKLVWMSPVPFDLFFLFRIIRREFPYFLNLIKRKWQTYQMNKWKITNKK